MRTLSISQVLHFLRQRDCPLSTTVPITRVCFLGCPAGTNSPAPSTLQPPPSTSETPVAVNRVQRSATHYLQNIRQGKVRRANCDSMTFPLIFCRSHWKPALDIFSRAKASASARVGSLGRGLAWVGSVGCVCGCSSCGGPSKNSG